MRIKLIFFPTMLFCCSFLTAQSQSKIDSLQSLKIDKLEKRIEPVENLKDDILLCIAGFTLLFGSLTLWNVFKQTKSLVASKQSEVIKNATEEILKNLSVQLGMPLEQVKIVLASVDKDSIIYAKKILVLNQDGTQRLDFLDGLKYFDTTPIFRKFEIKPDVNGFHVVIIDSLDDSLNDKILSFLKDLDGIIQIVLVIQQGKLEVNRNQYKSKIQFANDPKRLEPAIRLLFA